MKNKDKARRYSHKDDCLCRQFLSDKRELRFYLRVDSRNSIRSLEIIEFKKKGERIATVSSLRIPHRHIEPFLKTIDSLKGRMEKEAISRHEPDVTHLIHK